MSRSDEAGPRRSTHRRDSFVLGLAVGVVGATFGVLAGAAGFSFAKAMVLSLFVFTGASQFAAVGVIDSGGSPLSAVGSALLLAARNGLYGMRLSELLPRRGVGRAVGAHLVIDETTAMAVAQTDDRHAREAFWITGASLFAFWNLGTAAGLLLGELLGDPQMWGLDAAFLASFVALIGPHISERPGRVAAGVGALIAILTVPVTPAGAPILLAALAVIPAMFIRTPDLKREDGTSEAFT